MGIVVAAGADAGIVVVARAGLVAAALAGLVVVGLAAPVVVPVALVGLVVVALRVVGAARSRQGPPADAPNASPI